MTELPEKPCSCLLIRRGEIMPRANRHYVPGYAWHITHRCHRKDFLLKFARDRSRWLHWLFEAKKRYDLHVLNYTITSNHVHLLVMDRGDREAIPKSIQLIAGRTGQEFNRRKSRKGAFWEDRYHATVVETDEHLLRCIVYMDLNMVRAGVVKHPSEWPFGGYIEIQRPRERYSLIDHKLLMDLLGFRSLDSLVQAHRNWVSAALAKNPGDREAQWTESVAVGRRDFVETVRDKLGVKVKGRRLSGTEEHCHLEEEQAAYRSGFMPENGAVSRLNMRFWEIYPEISMQ